MSKKLRKKNTKIVDWPAPRTLVFWEDCSGVIFFLEGDVGRSSYSIQVAGFTADVSSERRARYLESDIWSPPRSFFIDQAIVPTRQDLVGKLEIFDNPKWEKTIYLLKSGKIKYRDVRDTIIPY